MTLKFVGSEPVAGDVTSFIFEPEEPVNWLAGQYFHYVLQHSNEDDRGEERWFTNSAAPYEKKVMISTRLNEESGSSFKKALKNLKPGDTIEADGPKGKFVIDDPSRNYLFIAGGIGITPFRSMLAQAAHEEEKLSVKLMYANRNQEIPFKDELDGYASQNPELKIDYVIDPQKIEEAMLKDELEKLDNPIVYVSGPEPMVKSFAELLQKIGVQEANLKTDDFPGYESY